MLTTLLLTTLAGLNLASAAPSPPGTTCPPAYNSSPAFKLVAVVVDPKKDVDPPIHGTVLQTAHIGPGFTRATLGQDSDSPGRVFYQNGTYEDLTMQRLGIISDGGTPPFPNGLTYQADDNAPGSEPRGQALFVNAGASGGGTRLSRLYEPISKLTILSDVVASAFVACPKSRIPYYGDRWEFTVLNWVQATRSSTGSQVVIPEGCVEVEMIPQCAPLEALPEGAYSSHEFVQEVRCYDDVKGIKWAKYGLGA